MTDTGRHVPLADRMAAIQPFHVMDLLARAKAMEAQGRSVIHLEVGEPDFPTPQPILEAVQHAIAQGDVHYTPALGLPALREKIAAYYQQRYGVTISPQRVVVTSGASGALMLALGVMINPGDQVLMSDPGYPCNRNFVRFLNGEPLPVAVDEHTQYQLTADQIRNYWGPRTVAALLASPSNPTGTTLGSTELQAISNAVMERGGRLLVDEIYHGLEYEGRSETALAISDEIIVINSFSKFFSMTGWRLGWMVVPPYLVDQIDRLAQNLYLAAPTAAQYGALAAFDAATLAILEQRCQEFKRRRDYLLPALRELGFTIPAVPAGAFYIYAGCERFTDDSYQFVQQVLEQTGVAITPGLDFGDNDPQHHVRFSYATSLENLQEAVRRLRAYLNV